MLSKDDEVFDSYNVWLLLFVHLFDVTQDLYLNKCLFREFLLIFDDF